MASAAEPSVMKDVITTEADSESNGLDILMESESMSVSSSDLSPSEVDVQIDSIENEAVEESSSSSSSSPKESKSEEQQIVEEKGQKVPVPVENVTTLDEVEVSAGVGIGVEGCVSSPVVTVEEEDIVMENDLPSEVPVPIEANSETEVAEVDEAVECTEVVVVEDANLNNSSCEVGEVDADNDIDVDLALEDDDDGKENKENEDEGSEGQIILTGSSSIEIDPASSITSLTAPATATVTAGESESLLNSSNPSEDEVVETEEIDLTLTSPTNNISVQVSTSTSEVISDEFKEKEEKLTNDKNSVDDTLDPIGSTKLTSSPSPSVSVSVDEPKIEDIENNINKIIHKSQSHRSPDSSSSSLEVKSELSDQIRAMKRSDLETLIVDKIIEAIAIHSNVGVLNQKLHQANAQKDRLFHKISNLQRQVTELSKAVRSVSENVGRNQKTVNKTNQPIRFYRSVGVQVFLEGPINPSPQSRAMTQEFTKPMIEPRKSVLKSGNNNTPSTLAQQQQHLKPVPGQVPLSSIVNGNVNPGLKRSFSKPTISVAEITKQLENQSKIRKVSPSSTPVTASPHKTIVNNTNGVGINTKSPLRSNVTVQQQQQQNQMVMRNPAAAVASKVLNLNAIPGPSKTQNSNGSHEPGIVDLTDDDTIVTVATTTATQNSNTPPKKTVIPATAATSASALIVNGKNNSNVVLSQNGVQYRLISPGPQYQFVQNGQSYQIVTSGNQTRPVFVSTGSLPKVGAQMRPGVATQNISLLRGLVPGNQLNGAPININSGGQFMMRPMIATAAKPVANTVTPVMTKQQQQFPQQQGQGQPVSISMVAPRQQQQASVQVVANRNMANNVVGLRIPNQAVRPMGQIPRANLRASVDAIKKFILPPLPPPAIVGNPRRCSKDIPPRPDLNLTEQEQGIVLSWTLKLGPNHAEIQTYQIYACQEPLFNNPKSGSWKRVGDVKALPLPMACTLSQFTDENRYHFIVRGVDVYNRTGPFCEAAAITLKKK